MTDDPFLSFAEQSNNNIEGQPVRWSWKCTVMAGGYDIGILFGFGVVAGGRF